MLKMGESVIYYTQQQIGDMKKPVSIQIDSDIFVYDEETKGLFKHFAGHSGKLIRVITLDEDGHCISNKLAKLISEPICNEFGLWSIEINHKENSYKGEIV